MEGGSLQHVRSHSKWDTRRAAGTSAQDWPRPPNCLKRRKRPPQLRHPRYPNNPARLHTSFQLEASGELVEMCLQFGRNSVFDVLNEEARKLDPSNPVYEKNYFSVMGMRAAVTNIKLNPLLKGR